MRTVVSLFACLLWTGCLSPQRERDTTEEQPRSTARGDRFDLDLGLRNRNEVNLLLGKPSARSDAPTGKHRYRYIFTGLRSAEYGFPFEEVDMVLSFEFDPQDQLSKSQISFYGSSHDGKPDDYDTPEQFGIDHFRGYLASSPQNQPRSLKISIANFASTPMANGLRFTRFNLPSSQLAVFIVHPTNPQRGSEIATTDQGPTQAWFVNDRILYIDDFDSIQSPVDLPKFQARRATGDIRLLPRKSSKFYLGVHLRTEGMRLSGDFLVFRN